MSPSDPTPQGLGTRAQSSPCAWPQKPGVLSQGQVGDPRAGGPPLPGPAGARAHAWRQVMPQPGQCRRPSQDGAAWPPGGQVCLAPTPRESVTAPREPRAAPQSRSTWPRPRGSAGRRSGRFWGGKGRLLGQTGHPLSVHSPTTGSSTGTTGMAWAPTCGRTVPASRARSTSAPGRAMAPCA